MLVLWTFTLAHISNISDRYRFLYNIYSNNANFNNHLFTLFFVKRAIDQRQLLNSSTSHGTDRYLMLLLYR